MRLLTLILISLLDILPGGQAFLKPVAEGKDTVRVGDQVVYGFELKSLAKGEHLAFPDLSVLPQDTLTLIRGWQIDTLSSSSGKTDISASVVLSPFEEGSMALPPLSVVRMNQDGAMDTLVFEPKILEVTPVQVDTANFQIKELKAPIKYPLTFKEVAPVVGGSLLLLALVVAVIFLIRKFLSSRKTEQTVPSDPAYIVALREFEKFRGDKYWAPEKQKFFYSGITDALKAYIADRYEFDAREMTTAELFVALKKCPQAPADLVATLTDIFEEADYVKFAKHFSEQETLAKVLPTAIGFVTQTYQKPEEQEASVNS